MFNPSLGVWDRDRNQGNRAIWANREIIEISEIWENQENLSNMFNLSLWVWDRDRNEGNRAISANREILEIIENLRKSRESIEHAQSKSGV